MEEAATIGTTPTGAQAGDVSVRLDNVVYLGPVTRYVVRLADGSPVGVLAQNLAQTSTEVRAAQGRAVGVVWSGNHAVAITTERMSEENG